MPLPKNCGCIRNPKAIHIDSLPAVYESRLPKIVAVCEIPKTSQRTMLQLTTANILWFSKKQFGLHGPIKNHLTHPGSVKSSQYALVNKKAASPQNVAVSASRLQKMLDVSEIRRVYTFTSYQLYLRSEKPASAPCFS